MPRTNDKSPTCDTFIFLEVECISLISDNLDESDNVCMIQLAENLDLTNCSDWKPFHLIFQPDFLQSNNISCRHQNRNNDILNICCKWARCGRVISLTLES